MKKILMLFFVVVLVFTSTVAVSFAETENGIEPRYGTVTTVASKVVLSGSKATYFAEVTPRNPTSIDSIKATIKLMNSSGAVISSTSGTMKKSGLLFNLSDTATLTKSGSYHVEYTLKIYKSGVLTETITGKSISTKF